MVEQCSDKIIGIVEEADQAKDSSVRSGFDGWGRAHVSILGNHSVTFQDEEWLVQEWHTANDAVFYLHQWVASHTKGYILKKDW